MENPLRTKLSNGQPILGIWTIIPSPIVVEIIGLAGFDFQILDMEHGVFDQQALDANIRACEAVNCSPLVRVPSLTPFVIQSVMDLGAHGIIVPQVVDEASARLAVQSMKYAPEGIRGYNPFTRAALYCNPPTNEIGKLNNRFGFSSVIIENEHALKDLDKILNIADLDMVYVGVYDMSVALGCKGDTTHPRMVEFVETTIRRIREADKAAGMMVKNQLDISYALKLGANVLVFAVDTYMIHNAAVTAVNMLLKARNKISEENR